MISINQANLDPLFAPKTVAIYEAKDKFYYFIEGFKSQGFDLENLFLISPTEDNLFGIRCYKSFDEIPIDSIDLVILAVGRSRIVNALKNILKIKKVKFFHIFTAGLGEYDEMGLLIELEMKQLIDSYEQTRAFGPNCMGVYSPKGHNAYLPIFPKERGNIGLIYQSGDLLTRTIELGSIRHKLTFSKGISVGNCMDLQISDFLEYYEKDSETEIIGIYFEGFPKYRNSEGKKLFELCKESSKPVLFLRGGVTGRAQEAVVTHTGSLGTDENIWKAIYSQTSLIEVGSSLDEMIDSLYIFSHLFKKYQAIPLKKRTQFYPKNKNALVILWSGGLGILDTDTLTNMGINLPLFKGETKKKLMEVYPIKVGSLSNPLDLPWISRADAYMSLCKAAITEDIDVVMMHTSTFAMRDKKRFKIYYDNLMQIRDHVESLNKLLILILFDSPERDRMKYYKMLVEDRFIVYPNLERAANSFLKLYQYGKKIKG